MANIFQQQVTPVKPKILEEAQIYVYMPTADANGKGMVSLNQRDFSSPGGHVSLRWPMKMMVEDLANPLARPSYTKLLEDEFVHTNNIVNMINPVTKVRYSSQTAELKLNRENRDALARPDLVMLDSNEFEATKVGQYNQYRIKRKNPQSTPTIVQVDPNDFNYQDGLVKIKWPFAHNSNSYGLVKIDSNGLGSLSYDNNNNLQLDKEKFKTNLKDYLAFKPTYGGDWVGKETFIDPITGLAKRNATGNVLLNITKDAVGLGKLTNTDFSERTYDEFGNDMKSAFNNRFATKLDKALWDGENGLFRDWMPPTNDRNTVQRWFMRLEEEDNSIWSSIRSMRLTLGFYNTLTDLQLVYPVSPTLFGGYAYIVETNSYWAIRPITSTRYKFVFRDNTGLESISTQEIGDLAINLNTGIEYSWDGTVWINNGVHSEEWEWYDTSVANLEFYGLVETNAGALQPNAPVENVSVGISGKWIQSDHIHPSDSTKVDTNVIDDAYINVTTLPATGTDFKAKFAKVAIYDSNQNIIIATIVTTPQYLSSVPSPKSGDLAIARNNKHIFEYNGLAWQDTNEIGSIIYDTNSVINVPYVRTTQYLHNWKKSPTMFQQDTNSNEYYWAGNKEEFSLLDLENLPNNSLIVVDDDEELIPGKLVVEEQLEDLGVPMNDTDMVVSIDQYTTIDDLPVTIVTEDAVPGVKGPRKKLKPMIIGSTTDSTKHNMLIENNGKIVQLGLDADRMLVTNTLGSPVASTINKDNVVITGLSDIIQLEPGQLIKATGTHEVSTWNTGLIANKPIVTTGDGKVKTLDLTVDRLLKSGSNSNLEVVNWLEHNLVKTAIGLTEQSLKGSNRVVLSSTDNTIFDWYPEGAVENALIVKGATPGQIKVKQNSNLNRILITGPNGTVSELGAASYGQIVGADIEGKPIWIDNPSGNKSLPQKVLTINPTASEANLFGGLVAVILSAAPDISTLRDNCIYYY